MLSDENKELLIEVIGNILFYLIGVLILANIALFVYSFFVGDISILILTGVSNIIIVLILLRLISEI